MVWLCHSLFVEGLRIGYRESEGVQALECWQQVFGKGYELDVGRQRT
jgi:hypothetical protein